MFNPGNCWKIQKSQEKNNEKKKKSIKQNKTKIYDNFFFNKTKNPINKNKLKALHFIL